MKFTVGVVPMVLLVLWVIDETATEAPLLEADGGRVSGTVEKSVKGRYFHSFYGIPYARPPVGKLRFKDPQPMPSWKITLKAFIPAERCVQVSNLMDKEGKIVSGKEDCLYLNVFTHQVNTSRTSPVMVWLHGGGLTQGSAQDYLPHVLLDYDVVLVVVQYRLGVLGFLSTEDSVMPGNLGLKDQTMALQWVQRNIYAFGGDNTRVTIFGESAGAATVHFQMLTPKAEGLFTRAILQSGAALCPRYVNNTPRKIAHWVASKLGCPIDQGSEHLLACLQGLDVSLLSPLHEHLKKWNSLPFELTPWVDGHYLPDHPAQLLREGRHAKLDIIAGVNKDEGAVFALPALAKKHFLEELQHNFSVAGPASLQLVGRSEDPVDVARQLYHHYLGTTRVTEAHAEDFMRMLSDRHYTVCHDLTIVYHARQVNPARNTFRYELQHSAQLSFGQLACPACSFQWVCHSDDLYYLFRGGPMLTPHLPWERPSDLQQPDDLALRDIILTLWTNFAATGNPTPDASLGFTWEPSTADNLHYLSLTPSPSMQPDNRKEVRRFHNSLPTQENLILHPHLVKSKSHDQECSAQRLTFDKMGRCRAIVTMAVMGVAIAADVPYIETKDGRLSGTVEESFKGRDFFSFYGIPYAQPPLGKLRFKDPEPFQNWVGLGEASVPAPPCIQFSIFAQTLGKNEVMGQEDCLYLNVFTPKVEGIVKLPVMVWLHGGAFVRGSGNEYLPHVLLDHDVVLVVVQYRLGVLGFLSTEDSVMPGNLGLKDQTMALEWVKRNIQHFGGDNTRITIFGESAGGASAHFQMLTRKAEGLFSRSILQSGTALCPWAINSNPRKAAIQVGNTLGCPTRHGSDALLLCLQGLDVKALFPLYDDFTKWYKLPLLFTPWVDGHFLPDSPAQLMLDGCHAKVDIISGITRDEGTLFALPALTKKHFLEELHHNFSVAGPASLQLVGRSEDPIGVARQLYHHYLGTTRVTEAHAEDFMRMLSDNHFAVCHDLTTARQAQQLHPAGHTFRYELQHYGQLSFSQLLCPSCDKKWVSHIDDLYYLFRGGNLLTPPTAPKDRPKDLQRPDDLALRDIITTLWTNFAATGNPTPDASLGFTWEPSTADNLHYLALTPSPSMQPDNRKEIRRLYNSLPLQENIILHPHLVKGEPNAPEDATCSQKTEL